MAWVGSRGGMLTPCSRDAPDVAGTSRHAAYHRAEQDPLQPAGEVVALR
jgi:hypothetical protein